MRWLAACRAAYRVCVAVYFSNAREQHQKLSQIYSHGRSNGALNQWPMELYPLALNPDRPTGVSNSWRVSKSMCKEKKNVSIKIDVTLPTDCLTQR